MDEKTEKDLDNLGHDLDSMQRTCVDIRTRSGESQSAGLEGESRMESLDLFQSYIEIGKILWTRLRYGK